MRALRYDDAHGDAVVKLTSSQNIALRLIDGRLYTFQEDVCSTRIARQLETLGFIERRTAGKVGARVTLFLTEKGVDEARSYAALMQRARGAA